MCASTSAKCDDVCEIYMLSEKRDVRDMCRVELYTKCIQDDVVFLVLFLDNGSHFNGDERRRVPNVLCL